MVVITVVMCCCKYKFKMKHETINQQVCTHTVYINYNSRFAFSSARSSTVETERQKWHLVTLKLSVLQICHLWPQWAQIYQVSGCVAVGVSTQHLFFNVHNTRWYCLILSLVYVHMYVETFSKK